MHQNLFNASMKSTLTFFAYLLLALSLLSCKSSHSTASAESSINSSALYTPTSVSTIKGTEYQFVEGRWKATGEKLYSQAAFTRALTIGKAQ
jgi:hypothetical protein